MDEPRESRLAAILARGLLRVRQRAERLGSRKVQDEPPPACVAEGEQATAQRAVVQQGDQQ